MSGTVTNPSEGAVHRAPSTLEPRFGAPAEFWAKEFWANVNRGRAQVWLRRLLLAITAIFFALHFAHLSADFPNHSPWMDWSKYTDEGWYGDAAIRHVQRGHWYVPGDFNPAVAMPIWPLLESLVSQQVE